MGSHFSRAAVVLTILAFFFPAGPAEAAFSSPVYLSKAGQNAIEPQVALDANGSAVIVWRRFDGTGPPVVQARTRSAAGVLGPVLNLSDNKTFYIPRVAVDPNGNAVFIWVHSDGTNRRAQGRRLSAAGVLGPVLDLSDPGQDVTQPDVAIDTSGNVMFTWPGPNAQARTLSAAGALGPVLDISDVALGGVGNPRVALDGGGDAVFAWSDASLVIRARTRSAAGTFGAVLTLSPTGSQYPQVVVNAGGDAAFVWNTFDGATNLPEGRTLSAAGALGPLKKLASSGQEGQVGIDAGGNALFAWVQTDANSVDRIWTRTYSAAGAVGPAKTVTPKKYNADLPGLAVTPAGDAVITWVVKLGGSHNIAARTRSAAGVLGAIQNVSKSSLLNTSAAPATGGNANGNVMVAWLGVDGTGLTRVRGSAGP